MVRTHTGFLFCKKQVQTAVFGIKPAQCRVQIIELADRLVIQDFRRFPARKNLLTSHADDPVRDFHREVNLMQRHHNRNALLPGHPVKNGEKFQLMTNIQIGSRLVEHDDFRFLTDGAREQDSLALAVTDCIKRSVGKALCMYGCKRGFYLLLIGIRQDTQASGVGITAHGGHIPAGHQLRLQPACQHDSHIPGKIGRTEPVQFFRRRVFLIRQKNFSAHRKQLTGDRLENRGLARSVGTDQGHDFPSLHTYFNPVDQGFSVITDDQMVEL